MRRFLDLQRLQRDLASGNRLKFNPALQSLILSQLERTLAAEVQWENLSIFYNSVQEDKMKEVHDLASGMKEAIASVKKISADAKSSLAVEISRAHTNASKVKSLATDLKSANLEVEDFLGETGSNFPSSEESTTPRVVGPKPDINGVILNPEAKK
jgi:hypothetical protein